MHPAEHLIRTMEEGTRSIVVGIPFLRITIMMVKCVVVLVTRNLNQFPLENGISNKYSPLVIVTRALLADARKYVMNFRSYMEIFEDNNMM